MSTSTHQVPSSAFAFLLAASANLGLAQPASADVYRDLAVEHVQVIPLGGGPGGYQVDVDLLMHPDALVLSQPVLVRVYASGQPQGETPLGTFATLSGECCSSGADCDAVSGWSVSCVGTCGSGSGGPYACAYRRRASFAVAGIAAGAVVTAIVDPDGWHLETGPAGTSNNSASALAPWATFHDLALESLTLTPQPLPGAFTVSVGVVLTPNGDSLPLPPLVRFFRAGLAIGEFAIDEGPGISGGCCDNETQCPPLDGFSVSCDGSCPGGIGGTRQCVYLKVKTQSIGGLAPGDVLTAMIDPDGLYYEPSPAGTSNNTVSAIVPMTIQAYCTGKLNSAGCVPSVTFSGAPSFSSPDAFVISATEALPGRNGVLFYGHQQAALPFLGGTLCVQAPVRRTPLQTSSGSPGQLDCSGVFSYDFNARVQSGIDPTLTVGANIAAQYWYRDSASSFGTGLSNALWFPIGN